MRNAIAATALALLGLAPASGVACEYADDSWASTAPTEQVGTAPAPAATTVAATAKQTAPAADKAPASRSTKPVVAKTKASATNPKLAASTTD